MRREQLRGKYDVVLSLGGTCLPALKMQDRQLRRSSGPLDWMISEQLTSVNRLLQSRFAYFFDRDNLIVSGQLNFQREHYLVDDRYYHVTSVHDFDIGRNSPANLAQYEEVQAKFTRRCERFLRYLETADRILFIRAEGHTYSIGKAHTEELEQTAELLNQMVRGSFFILYVRPALVSEIVDINYVHDQICVLDVPPDPVWYMEKTWDAILEGISL
ncbi:DUF1796 family putative cysteine peptidase [Paenibacillus sp. 481]|uniref:DUF1796 family putative cysteine peptidase n=1 Tax=Paenibacillus sp. 481 TaxID=2835869 RepID=UPI001E50D984|nr:DUF1796 family putative cysteine peptidase [Paenibacillus sp. 481]UHA73593.1 peptidase [Paenibacillus sp. 481]